MFDSPFGNAFDVESRAGGVVAAIGAVAALAARKRTGALVLAEVAALAMLALPSATGHAIGGPQREALSIPGDLAHVLAATVWIGGLASLAAVAPVVLRRVDRAARNGALTAMAERFTPLALGAVALLGATGLIRAVGELGSVSQLWGTGYGRALIVKSTLFAVALTLAWLNRDRLTGAAVARAVRPELAVLVLLIAVVAVLTDLSPGRSRLAAAATASRIGASPVALAGQAGDWAVGLSLAPTGRNAAAVRARVIGADGPRSGLAVRFLASGGAQRASACGRGCYQAAVRLPSERPRLAVAVAAPGGAERIAPIAMPAAWPVPPATAALRRADSTWRHLRSLDAKVRIASDARHSLTTAWRFRAPDRLAYRNLPTGSEAIVIGARRWDRPSPRARWQESPQDSVRQPVPPWSRASAFAHLLGTRIVGGRKLLRVAFLDRSGPAWFTIWVDAATHRTTRVDMIAQAHFMRQANSQFDSGAPIERPG